KIFHKYVLGVYSLYERLLEKFPEILFESCSSGGARFDPGMLYYAPQTWTSDDTDAVERLKIQYGTSYVYPISSMGAHVSKSPNLQVGRMTPVETRGNVAMFGTFGYEMDLDLLSENEKEVIVRQVAFVKKHRKLIANGLFYRLKSPFDKNVASWIIVSDDQTEALAAYYQILKIPNGPFRRLSLAGLKEDRKYCVNGDKEHLYYGDELMYVGLMIDDAYLCDNGGDFCSAVFEIEQVWEEKAAGKTVFN
ncbi:MAG TPA: alpha-galactosidase, partial [Lachnospiraceae bacterium]|nr:alpha-galactosidase [Lachnospiraceae bacterium]